MRLEMCQEEKSELEKQLKQTNIKSSKTDELKLKHDKLSETHKQVKSRYLLLVEKVKEHAENHCVKPNDLLNVINKLSKLTQPLQEKSLKFMKTQEVEMEL